MHGKFRSAPGAISIGRWRGDGHQYGSIHLTHPFEGRVQVQDACRVAADEQDIHALRRIAMGVHQAQDDVVEGMAHFTDARLFSVAVGDRDASVNVPARSLSIGAFSNGGSHECAAARRSFAFDGRIHVLHEIIREADTNNGHCERHTTDVHNAEHTVMKQVESART